MITDKVKTIWIQASWLGKNDFGFIKICLVLVWVCAWGWVFGKRKWNLPGLKLKQMLKYSRTFYRPEKENEHKINKPCYKNSLPGRKLGSIKPNKNFCPWRDWNRNWRQTCDLRCLHCLINVLRDCGFGFFPSHDSLRVVQLKELEEARTECCFFCLR